MIIAVSVAAQPLGGQSGLVHRTVAGVAELPGSERGQASGYKLFLASAVYCLPLSCGTEQVTCPSTQSGWEEVTVGIGAELGKALCLEPLTAATCPLGHWKCAVPGAGYSLRTSPPHLAASSLSP